MVKAKARAATVLTTAAVKPLRASEVNLIMVLPPKSFFLISLWEGKPWPNLAEPFFAEISRKLAATSGQLSPHCR